MTRKTAAFFAQVGNNSPAAEAPTAEYQAPWQPAPAPSPSTTSPPTEQSPIDEVGEFISTLMYTDGRIVHDNKNCRTDRDNWRDFKG